MSLPLSSKLLSFVLLSPVALGCCRISGCFYTSVNQHCLYRWFVDSFHRVPGLFLLFSYHVSLDPVRSQCCFFSLTPRRLCCCPQLLLVLLLLLSWCGVALWRCVLSMFFQCLSFSFSFSVVHFVIFCRRLSSRGCTHAMPLIYLFAFICLNEQ